MLTYADVCRWGGCHALAGFKLDLRVALPDVVFASVGGAGRKASADIR